MTIEALKEMERLKEELSKLQDELTQRENNELRVYTNTIISDFMKYFEEKDFTVIKNRADIVATYKGLKFVLKAPTERLMGVIFYFDLLMSDKKVCSVLLRSADQESVSVTIKSGSDTPEENVARLRKDIAATKEKLSRSTTLPLTMFVRTDQKNLDLKEFGNISEILDAVIG